MLLYGGIMGVMTGTLYGLGEAGLIPNWRGQEDTPAAMRLFLVFGLMSIAAGQADSVRGFLLVGLIAVGSAKVADLTIRTAVDAVGWVRGWR